MIISEEQHLIQQTALQFVNEQIRPFASKWAEQSYFPKKELQALGELGFMGMLLPETFGGSELDYLTYALVLEEIAKGDGGISTILAVHNSVAALPILQFGNKEIQQQYLPKLSSGEMLGCFCLTEPQAGSEASALKTTAIKDGEHYVLNGVKQFITSGKNAGIAIVFAKTSPDAGAKGISAFVVPTKTKGFEVARLEEKMGQHTSDLAQIVLDNCKIPTSHLLGDEGQGYKIALSNLEGGRLGIAAQAIGMGQAALEESILYAKERHSFGKPLIEHQAIGFKLAEMATEIEAARQLLHFAARKRDLKEPCLTQAAQAKLFASEVAEKVCREAIQIFGGYGYLKDFPVERIYRDVRVCTIYEGTSEVQKMIIAKSL